MDSLLYIFRFLYRIRYWLLVAPIIIALFVYFYTANRTHTFSVTTTIHTGIVSGYNTGSNEENRPDMHAQNSMIDNLINIITAKNTLKNVSLRLYVQDMIQGDPEKDNIYITAAHYRNLQRITPEEVKALIVKDSLELTLANLKAYEKPAPNNFVYGLFYWYHPHYSYEALKNILVQRLGNSDMIEISYTCDDPGIAYNTLKLLNEEFIRQYNDIRFGETVNVIRYFEEELARIAKLLRASEDSLIDYNIRKRVINYDEQTAQIAMLNSDYELKYQDMRLLKSSAEALITTLEKQIDEQVLQLRSNSLFLGKLNEISDLTSKIARFESFRTDSLPAHTEELQRYKNQLAEAEKEFNKFSNVLTNKKYTKEGVATNEYVSQWLEQLINLEKANSQLKVMELRKKELDNQYVYFSPIGSTLKRKEREINFLEQTYLNILHNLNAARLRQKSLEMSTATIKILNPPTFPLTSTTTRRAWIVLAAFAGTIVFIIGYFFLLELLDRTLRDSIRTERLTGGKVLGAFPATSALRFRGFSKECNRIATHYLSNSLLGLLPPRHKPAIINFLSLESGEGKSFIISQLTQEWESKGLKVKVVSWHKELNPDSKEYILAEHLQDLSSSQEEDMILVEYPPLNTYPVPASLLQEADINLLILRASRTWKDADQLSFKKLTKQAGNSPVFLYLTQAERLAVEKFTGLLPPYTYFRKVAYKLYQMGLTSKEK